MLTDAALHVEYHRSKSILQIMFVPQAPQGSVAFKRSGRFEFTGGAYAFQCGDFVYHLGRVKVPAVASACNCDSNSKSVLTRPAAVRSRPVIAGKRARLLMSIRAYYIQC